MGTERVAKTPRLDREMGPVYATHEDLAAAVEAVEDLLRRLDAIPLGEDPAQKLGGSSR